MTSAGNLSRDEAQARAKILHVASYDVDLDLTVGSTHFDSSSTVRFSATPGAATFIEAAADSLTVATLNGVALDLTTLADGRLPLPDLAADNELTVTGRFRYSRTGEGLHRFVDPVDDGVYLYTQFESYEAHRMYACFDQPDLKATYHFAATMPNDWLAVSNAPIATRDATGDASRVEFETTARMSTYITALIAGPYYEVRDVYEGPHGTIPLGLYCRASMAQHLTDADAGALFTVTRQGFDFYHRVFDYPYPFGKYDQLFVPEFNAGAMENAGAVTFLEDYVFRSKVTDARYERRAETVLHEMAHMWFGDLVTMTWWDDLWLNESFATFMSVLCMAQATRWTNAWTTFCNTEKSWGYRADQMPGSHPIAADAIDIDTAKANFDGITYAKGASVLKQLVAWVGQEEFLAGLRTYFRAHEFANTQLSDLMTALHESSGRELTQWGHEWLETTGVNTLRARFTTDGEDQFTAFTVVQEAPEEHPTLRSHRLAIGLYDRVPGEGLVRRERVELDIVGAETEVGKLIGTRRPDLILLNDDDLTFAKIRFDPQSLATLVSAIGEFRDSLPRALCWAAAWDMTRDAEMPARDYLELVLAGASAEDDIGVVQSLLMKAQSAVTLYGDPARVSDSLRRLADACDGWARAAEPGSDLQLAFVIALASSATGPHLATIAGLLDGSVTLPGLAVDTDLRWTLVTELAARGVAGDAEIDAELARDKTSAGEKRATTARTAQPTEAAKAAAYAAVMDDDALSNHLLMATVVGFWRADQVDLVRPYVARYFNDLAAVWATRSTEMAHVVTQLFYPGTVVEQGTLTATDAFLAEPNHSAALRRLVGEGRDGVARALRARACDLAANDR